MSRVLDETRTLLAEAATAYAGTPYQPRLIDLGRRLEEPLRVAIAGRVKAGKSTLLNALVADRLAPTDAGECTRIVTWYADGHTYRVLAEPYDGPPRQLPFERTDDAVRVDLTGLAPAAIARLRVTWPTRGLRRMSLIDTPGIGSLSEDVSARTWDLLAAEDEQPGADAVLYLLRHLHGNDLELLRAFQDSSGGRPSPVNAIGVLSRADEVGAGRLDALASARKVAGRIAAEPTVRRMVQTVVPVAGLLAETGATVTESEFAALRRISELAKADTDQLLLTVDRFVHGYPELLDAGPGERQRLLDRFGMFGIRISASMVKHGVVTDATGLSAELLSRSGIEELRDVLETLFLQRSDLLKSRVALLAVDAVARAHPVQGSDRLAMESERIAVSAHAFRELDVLAAIRAGWVSGKDEVVAEAERLVGGRGVRPAQRLGLDPDSDDEAVRSAAALALERWQRRAESPMTSHQMVVAARTVIQSCEGMLADLHGWSR